MAMIVSVSVNVADGQKLNPRWRKSKRDGVPMPQDSGFGIKTKHLNFIKG
jgi:hypothetical protein